MTYKLVLGNKNYSSWSLRGWLLLRGFDIEFEEQVVPLYTDAFTAAKQEMAPARLVPTLIVRRAASGDDWIVWDSLAIAEFLHEQHPDAGIWPGDPQARALARSLCAEMHAGFGALRSTMPMNMRRQIAGFEASPEAQEDIARIQHLWSWASGKFGGEGPYLFGASFTAADAFFAPVASRFRTYRVKLTPASAAYVDAIHDHPAVAEFSEAAKSEPWTLDHAEL